MEISPSVGSAITDIVFVSSLSSKPQGYTAIEHTFGEYNAQLYDKGFRRRPLTSYLCYTTIPDRDDLVVENIYVHSVKSEPPRKGYQIIKYTVDGNKAMRHMKLAIKRVPRHEAKSVICDIVIYRNNDQDIIPDDYIPLAKVNNLRITYLLVSYRQSSHALQSASSLLVDSHDPSSSEMVRRGFGIFKRFRARQLGISPGPSLQSSSQSVQARKRIEKPAIPVTDIVLVSSLDNVPKGYIPIEKCESGRSAQLWQPLLGGLSRKRYLCFTRNKQTDETIIESMYMLGSADQFLSKGYSLIKKTIEGDEPLRQRHLAVRRTAKSKALTAVVDIGIYHIDDSDSIPTNYTAVKWSVNNLLICFLSAARNDLQEEKKQKRFRRK